MCSAYKIPLNPPLGSVLLHNSRQAQKKAFPDLPCPSRRRYKTLSLVSLHCVPSLCRSASHPRPSELTQNFQKSCNLTNPAADPQRLPLCHYQDAFSIKLHPASAQRHLAQGLPSAACRLPPALAALPLFFHLLVLSLSRLPSDEVNSKPTPLPAPIRLLRYHLRSTAYLPPFQLFTTNLG